jgi:S1-C subfamily serine protease
MSRSTAWVGLAALLAAWPFSTPLHAQGGADPEASVVKVFVTSSPWDPFTPWQRVGTETSTGSATVLSGNRLLTNAHVVEDAVSLEVKAGQPGSRYAARVSFVDAQADLALLEVEDSSFFASVRPLTLGETPPVQTAVQAYGFPVGGDTVSVTSGIISRIEIGNYAHSMEALMMAQIDAALNPGNSGGPVVAGGKLVGVALQILDQAENVGYLIPSSVIQHFLDDVKDGNVDGFPDLGIVTQGLENAALRQSLGMKEPQSGALVNWVDSGAPADGVLQPRDVLLEVDGRTVSNDMSIDWRSVGRAHFSQACRSRQVGDRLTMKFLRRGLIVDGAMTLDRHDALVPGWRRTAAPQYLVFGGLVFQPLTVSYLLYLEEVPYDLGDYATLHNRVTRERSQLILLQKVLPHPVNRGYQGVEDQVVEKVNGTVPHDMAHLATLIDGTQGQFVEIETGERSLVTVSVREARAAQQAILTSYGLHEDRSPDLRPQHQGEALPDR